MARRYLRRFSGEKIGNDFTNIETYSICNYLYWIFESTANVAILDEYSEVLPLFSKCARSLDKLERLEKILAGEIKNLAKRRRLTRIKKKDENAFNQIECFDDFDDIPFTYEQDKRVDRYIRRCRPGMEQIYINLIRIMLFSDQPIFSKLINAVIFSEKEDYSIFQEFAPKKRVRSAMNDISKTKFLVEQVKISEEEARYLLLRYRFDEMSELRDMGRCVTSANWQERVANMVGVTKNELRKMLRNDSKLKEFGFIDQDGDYNRCMTDCIEAQSIEPYFSEVLKPLECDKAYDLDSFSAKSESKEICLDLLRGQNPVSILFYGKPGAGKTELAKTLGKLSGKKVYVFKNETETDEGVNVLGRLTCLLSMERPDSIIIVDEADTILKGIDFTFFGPCPSAQKGTINKMLENNKDKVIYIINHKGQIDESTMRRFTFSVKFEDMPKETLKSIAMSKIDPLGLDDETKEKLFGLFDSYHLTGSSVENVVKTIQSMSINNDEDLLKKAKIVMQENSLLLNGKKKMRQKAKAEYDPTVLNATMDAEKIVGMVKNAVKFAEENKEAENGVRMLFYGLSGTGKTELARYISEQLGKEIVLRRPSDILSKYVGEDEQNIRDAFEEAERTGAVLLFDEADTFFYDRRQAKNSWERSLVNEFLTQMEEFNGILICTTNLRKVMDPAMQRRFHILVEFKPMKFDGIKKMADRYFPDFHLSNKQIEELEDMESATPGDFGVLASRIRFLDPVDVNSDYILEELKKMQDEKKQQWEEEESGAKRKIGFGA